MNEDQFTKLYNYMNKEFASIHAELNAKASAENLERVYRIIDGLYKRIDDHVTEQEIINNRYLNWIDQLADTTQTSLQPAP